MDIRQAVITFYREHNPQKLKDVDTLLQTFKGREQALLTALHQKYAGTTSLQESLNSHPVDTEGIDELPHTQKPHPLAEPLTLTDTPLLSSERQREMRELLTSMSCIDLVQLSARVTRLAEERPSSSDNALTEETEGLLSRTHETAAVLSHAMTFMDFFLQCATKFLALAEQDMNCPRTGEQGFEVGKGRHTAVAGSPSVETQAASPLDRGKEVGSMDNHNVHASTTEPRTSPSHDGSPTGTSGRVGAPLQSVAITTPPSLRYGEDGRIESPPPLRTTTLSPTTSSPYSMGHTSPPNVQGSLSEARLPVSPLPMVALPFSVQQSPPSPQSPPPIRAGPLVSQTANRAYSLGPGPAGSCNAIGLALREMKLHGGDCLALQPGIYYENIVFEDCGTVEVTAAYPGAAVVLRPLSDLEPIMRVGGIGSQVLIKGIVLVQGDVMSDDGRQVPWTSRVDTSVPMVPLLTVTGGADVTLSACHLYSGAGGGVVAAGAHTCVRMDLCLVSMCGFAGVYVHSNASAELRQSKIKRSEAGLRVSGGSFFFVESTAENNTTDGIVVYDNGVGVVEKSCIFNNGGNGIFLADGAETRVVASTVELNSLYGVQRFRGSTLHIKSSFVRDNGLLPISDEATTIA